MLQWEKRISTNANGKLILNPNMPFSCQVGKSGRNIFFTIYTILLRISLSHPVLGSNTALVRSDLGSIGHEPRGKTQRSLSLLALSPHLAIHVPSDKASNVSGTSPRSRL